MDKYKHKENYITRDPNPIQWKNHPNNGVLNIYSEFIKGSVLDFGCNHGACTFLISENKNVKSVIGLDLNNEAINIANKTKKEISDIKTNFICDNIIDVDFNDVFDTIISFHTIEHIYPDDIDFVLKKLRNSLKEDGFFITSIPYEHSFDDGTQHVAFYNEITLSKLFEKNGFTTIECLYDNRHNEGGILTGVFKKI